MIQALKTHDPCAFCGTTLYEHHDRGVVTIVEEDGSTRHAADRCRDVLKAQRDDARGGVSDVEMMAFIRSHGWTSSCLYDGRWNPPSVQDARYRPDESSPWVFSLDNAYRIERGLQAEARWKAGLSL